ncbi:MAG: MBOAT family protein [Oscillospiraceae bacterium]|nr:MBOAT family protein [Oscillospiraceae bacterium]
MAYTSLMFLAFLLLTVVVYYIVPKKWQWSVLLVASYGFYLSSGVEQVLYILFTTLFSYFAARWMQKLRDDNQAQIDAMGEITKDEKRAMKKAVNKKIHTIQVVTVLVNLLILGLVKFANTFVRTFNEMFAFFQWDASIPLVNILVPLGLSYYTFNSIGYLIDVGRGKYPAEKHLGKFSLFVSFFPVIVQGPLCRFQDVGQQLQQPHKLEYNNLKYGAQLMLWGFFKKLVIAERVSVIALKVFHSGFSDYTGSHVFFGVLAYSFQIYGDFSGGTDICRGAAQMLGINLPMNFERPFFATSMGDYWHRWHMSLGAWMREYVFYPVMLSKPVTAVSKKFRKKFGAHAGKIVPSVAAPFVVFFLMGIWHGITIQRVVNGLYHATLISSSVALAPVFKKTTEKLKIRTDCFSFRLFQMLRTFFLLCISRIITQAATLRHAARMIKTLFTSWSWDFILGIDKKIYTYGVDLKNMQVLVCAIIALLVVGILQERGVKIRESLSKQNLIFRWFMILALLVFVLVFGMYGPDYNASDFIYAGH